MNDKREEVVERLYDVMLAESVGEERASDLRQRVRTALETGEQPTDSIALEPVMRSARWWFAPFATAATAALLLLVVGIVYNRQTSDDRNTLANQNAEARTDQQASGRTSSPPLETPNDYAIVRTTLDISALDTNVSAIVCDGVAAQEITQLAQRDLKRLEHLTFVRCNFDGVDLDQLNTPSSLQEISFEECTGLSDGKILLANTSNNLTHLKIIRCSGITPSGVTQLQLEHPTLKISVEYIAEREGSSPPMIEPIPDPE